MPFIAAPVAIWVAGAATAVGVTAATAATIGAVAGAVAVGVVSGAVVGAAGAAITGGNILDGAIKGAVIGGISAGVFSGLGMATGLASSSSQLSSMGVNSTATGMLGSTGSGAGVAAAGLTGPEAGLVPSALETPAAIEAGTGAIAAPTVAQSAAPVAKRSFMNKMLMDSSGGLSDAAGKVISSGVEGAATALLTDTPEVESQSEYLKAVQSMNASGKFQDQVANIQIPDHWKKYTQIPATPVNPTLNTSVVPGGAYAQPA